MNGSLLKSITEKSHLKIELVNNIFSYKTNNFAYQYILHKLRTTFQKTSL